MLCLDKVLRSTQTYVCCCAKGLIVPRLGTERYAAEGGFNLDCLAPCVPQSCQSGMENTPFSQSAEVHGVKSICNTHTHTHRKIKHRARQSVPPSEQIPVHDRKVSADK